MSSAPKAATVSPTTPSISAFLLTSKRSAMALLPIARAADFAASPSMSAKATRAPSRA
jgi:hypothetical protein